MQILSYNKRKIKLTFYGRDFYSETSDAGMNLFQVLAIRVFIKNL